MKIVWRPEMSVDGGVVDQDHRHLIELTNEFLEQAQSLAGHEALMAKLEDYRNNAVHHFGHEEALQYRIDYPFIEAHRREHEALRRRLETIIDVTSSRTEDDVATLSVSVFTLLKSWLGEHITQSDTRMKRFVQDYRRAKRPAVPA